MKVLIYGGKGWIGSQFIELLQKRNIHYVLGKARCDNEEELKEEIKQIAPTNAISFIGRTHGTTEDGVVHTTIDYLEQPGKLYENVRDNLFSPLLLAHICNEKNIHFTYLGTGCIYEYDSQHILHEDGSVENGFIEEDKPNFMGSSYSTVKGFTDRLIQLYHKNVLQLKIRMPIVTEESPRNFITKITTYEKICSIPNSMSVLPELLPIALQMMIDHKIGTYNFTNPGVISHNQILEMYREIVNPHFTWTNFTIEEQDKILASKRSNNYLDTSKLEAYVKENGHLELLPIHDSIQKILYSLNTSP